MSELHVRARHVPLPRGIALVDAPGLGIAADARAHRHQRPLAQPDAVADRRIDAEEAVRLDGAMAAEDDVRREHDMIAQAAVVADVVATPKRDVIPDRDEGLDSIVLQDQAILAN